MTFTEKYLQSQNSLGLVHHNMMYQYMQYFDQQMTMILQKRLNYTKKCKVFAKKGLYITTRLSYFLLTESLLHMAERKW